MASASSASLRESEGSSPQWGPGARPLGRGSGGRSPPEANHIFSIKGSSVGSRGKASGQGVWGTQSPKSKLITFSQLKDPKSLLQVTVCQSCDS